MTHRFLKRPRRLQGHASGQARRVTFVITSMPVGGAETLLVNLMRRFDPRRIQCDVVCLKEPGPLGESIATEFPLASNLIGSKWDVAVLWRLIKHFRRRKTDVVVTVGAGDKMFWGRLAAAFAGVPGIASALHSTGWPDGVGRANRWLDGITDAYIAVADSHGKFLCEFERFPAEKVCVVRNGVDCERFGGLDRSHCRSDVRAELGIAADSPLVGIVAALRPEKNHAMFVESAAGVLKTNPDAHFVIIGDGPERDVIEALAADLEIADRIHLLGSRDDTPHLLAALDVFVLSSFNEASPVSILEALASRVAVVATEVGSVSETVRPGETGILVPAGIVGENNSAQTAAMVSAIHRLLSDDATRMQLGENGRRWVRQSGSLDAMVDGYSELIRRLSLREASKIPLAASNPIPDA